MTRVSGEGLPVCGFHLVAQRHHGHRVAVKTEPGALGLKSVPALPPPHCLTLGSSLNLICKMGADALLFWLSG